MASVKQVVTINGYKATNSNAKYKLKYTYSQKSTTINGTTTTKYSFSKLLSSIFGKKYSYT